MTTYFTSFLTTELNILFTTLTWRDGIEIIVLTFFIYRFMYWLSLDQQKPLIGYFYQYSLLFVTSYYLQLTTITLILTISLPFALCALYLFHQKTLQKNFIALKKITAPPVTKNHWVEELIRTCVHQLHKQKNSICLIERNDSLIDFLHIFSFFNADITTDLLDMLCDTSKDHNIFVISKTGALVTFNPTITISVPPERLTNESKKLSYQEQQLLLLATQTDALIFQSSFHNHLFTLHIGEITIEKLTSNQLLLMLKKHLYSNEGISHEKRSISSIT